MRACEVADAAGADARARPAESPKQHRSATHPAADRRLTMAIPSPFANVKDLTI
jgi:hypothetical protein